MLSLAPYLYAYLGVGLLLAAALATYLVDRYRRGVLVPAAAIHGRDQVAVGRDALALATVSVAVTAAWLPLLLAFGLVRLRGALARGRSRENNPTTVA